jgi:hypothetical protein
VEALPAQRYRLPALHFERLAHTHPPIFLTVPTSSQPGSSVGGLASTAPNALVEKTSATVTRNVFHFNPPCFRHSDGQNASKFAAMTIRFLLTGLVLVCHRVSFEVGELRTTMASLFVPKNMHSNGTFFDVPNAAPSPGRSRLVHQCERCSNVGSASLPMNRPPTGNDLPLPARQRRSRANAGA